MSEIPLYEEKGGEYVTLTRTSYSLHIHIRIIHILTHSVLEIQE